MVSMGAQVRKHLYSWSWDSLLLLLLYRYILHPNWERLGPLYLSQQAESSRKTNPNAVFGTESRFGTAEYYKKMDKKQIFRRRTAEERSSFVPLSSMLGRQSVKGTARSTVFTTENRFGPPKKNMSSKVTYYIKCSCHSILFSLDPPSHTPPSALCGIVTLVLSEVKTCHIVVQLRVQVHPCT